MKRNPEKHLAALVVATGISSVVSQLLIIREYLTRFQGNEYVIALIFFAWLLLGGLGSLLSTLIDKRFLPAAIGRLAWLSLFTAVLPMATLLAIRLGRDVIFTPGVSTGFYQTFAFVFVTLGPYGVLVGFILPYTLAVLRSGDPGYAGTKVYMFDNIGDCAGGALFAFVLIFLCTPLQAMAAASGILVLAAYSVGRQGEKAALTAGFAAIAAALGLAAGLWWEIPSLQPTKGQLAWYQESRFGRVTAVQDREQVTIFHDGAPLSSSLDVAAAEAAIHYPMSQTRSPAEVLIISAGGGMFKELEKYQPLVVDYVELNPVITDAHLRFKLLKNIKGLNLIRQDGRAYLAGTAKRYDVVIVNISDPETFQANRYYTAAFYRLVKKRLKVAGILSFSVEGYANYLSETRQRFVSSLHRTVRMQFAHVLLLQGSRIFFICSDDPLDVDIPGRLEQKGIQTDYVAGYFYGNISAERITDLSQHILTDIPLNRDTDPYLMRLAFDRWFAKFATSPHWLYLILGVLLAGYAFRMSQEEYLLFSTGFMTMGTEIMVIFAFQIFFGYIYSQVSLIVTIFLAGLLPGALLGHKLRRQAARALKWTDGLLITLCLLLAAMILPENAQPSSGSLLLFGFCVSILCGCQFPLALKTGGEDQSRVAYAFSADLIGAACGALLVSVLLIPYLGLAGTLLVLIGVKVSSLMVVGLRPVRSD